MGFVSVGDLSLNDWRLLRSLDLMGGTKMTIGFC